MITTAPDIVPRASVIVPACNEAATIGGLLDEITLIDTAIEIVVVCNGCDDGTEAISTSYAPRLRTISMPSAGKAAALNLGLAETSGPVVVMLDADIAITGAGVERLTALAAQAQAADIVQPRLVYQAAHAGALVRAYLRVWQSNPYFATKVGGVYALTARGVRRLGSFPAIWADDEYVRRRLFDGVVWTDEVKAVVYPPATARALVRTRSRSLSGARGVIRDYGAGAATTLPSFRRTFVRLLLRRPVDCVVYAGIALAARLYAVLTRKHRVWTRDETSRRSGVRSSISNA